MTHLSQLSYLSLPQLLLLFIAMYVFFEIYFLLIVNQFDLYVGGLSRSMKKSAFLKTDNILNN